MSNVVHIQAPREPRADERMQFCLARRAMNQALMAWLATNPSASDVAAEVETTVSAVRQLHAVTGGAA